MPKSRQHWGSPLAYQRFKALLVGLISVALFSTAAPAWAGLPQGNAVKDPAAILRDALPFEQADIRELQHRLELTSDDLRAKRWPALGKTVSRSEALLNTRRNTMLDAVPTDRRDKAEGLLELVDEGLIALKERIAETDKPGFIAARRSTLSRIGDVEALMVDDGFEHEIPAEFDALPRLQGRATLAISTSQGDRRSVTSIPQRSRSVTFPWRFVFLKRTTRSTTKPLKTLVCSKQHQLCRLPPSAPSAGPTRTMRWMMDRPSSSCSSTRLS